MSRRKEEVAGEEKDRLVDRDLTALARAGKLPLAYGVESEVGEVLALLDRADKHPLLVGEPGVGKTALVQEVARAIVGNQVSDELAGGRLVEVSVAAVLARGERRAAEELDRLLERLADSPKTVVYVRDLALALNSPALPPLVKALQAGDVRFIVEADPQRAKDLLRADEVLASRLHQVFVAEPMPERARWILGQVADELSVLHGLAVAPAACDEALRLARKFLIAEKLPRRAVELLRESAAQAAAAGQEQIGREEVLTRFCSSTRLPGVLVDDALPLDLVEMASFFGERLLGQTDAVAAVLRSVASLKAGLNDPRRPLGVFLFAGPTGVGKTYLAKLLAEYLFGSADRLVRLNMADFPNDGDENVPFGAPWAESVAPRRGTLTTLLDGKVFAVLLLDEFEKAHPKVHDRFLQMFDEGRFVNAAGETVACGNVLIIATSNVGAEVYREAPLGFAGTRSPEDLIVEVDRRIAEKFRAEFLNRFDAICHFQPLSRTEIRKIAHREVGRVLEREGIRGRGLDVEVAPEVVDLLVQRGYSPLFGARFLQREIERTLTAALAEELVKRPLSSGTQLRVEVRSGGSVVAKASPRDAPREARAQVALPRAGAAAVKRRLDKRSLLAEAEALVQRTRELCAAMGKSELEGQRARLLEVTQSPTFWDDPEGAASVLRDYRVLEARLTEMNRVVSACEMARRRLREVKGEPQLAPLARVVEEAAREAHLLEARAAAGSAGQLDEVLLEIEGTTDGPGVESWVGELASMYSAWAERRGYEVGAIAESESPPRVVLRVSGPGARGFLMGEAGIHRRVEQAEPRQGAYVRLQPWPAPPTPTLMTRAQNIRRQEGFFVKRLSAEVLAREEASGRTLTLRGPGELPELCEVARALFAIRSQGVSSEVRRYLLGRAARVEDPRTGVSTPRVKDVLRGELELFIAAWMAQGPADMVRPA